LYLKKLRKDVDIDNAGHRFAPRRTPIFTAFFVLLLALASVAQLHAWSTESEPVVSAQEFGEVSPRAEDSEPDGDGDGGEDGEDGVDSRGVHGMPSASEIRTLAWAQHEVDVRPGHHSQVFRPPIGLRTWSRVRISLWS
jgi:hypothetical protein